MSDINTVFTYFETRNHTGNLSTSSYTLPFCYFTFTPKLETTTVAPPLTTINTTLSVINETSFLAAGATNWHALETNDSGVYTIATYGGYDVVMGLFESDQTTLIAIDDNSGPGLDALISTSLSSATTYYVKISGSTPLITGTYTIQAAGPATIQVPIVEQIESSSAITYGGRFSNKRIVWDFGDGTSSESITGAHSYSQPGRYKVTCYLYDRQGESYYDTFIQNVDVVDYVPNYLTLSASNTLTYNLTAGRITDPIAITRSTSWQYYSDGDYNKPISIISFISGSSTSDYFEINDRHYTHLYPSHSTYLLLTGSKNETEFVEVSSFEIPGTSIYTKLSNNTVVETNKEDPDGIFSGNVGTRMIYTKDDIASSKINVLFGYDSNTLKPISNTSTVGVSANIAKNTDLHHLSITSNGLDSEGFTTNLFNINKTKFSNSKISFVVKVKDSEGFTIRDLPLIENLDVILTDGITNYPANFYSNFGSLTSLTAGGFYKGYMVVDTSVNLLNVFLSAFCVVDSIPITGVSDTFNVYISSGAYDIAKRGEDIDFKETFKSIAFQPLFIDKKVLFEDFIGSIFGNISSAQPCIGKTTYEKIKNFVDNNTVVDYSNIDQLDAILELLNVNTTALRTPNAITPGEITRLIDLLSINRSRLFGAKNEFKENFKSYGYLDNSVYASNLGQEVSIYHTITGGHHLVAFEKFSGNYKLVNTYIPLCATTISVSSNNTYTLHNYNDTWGWGLILPEDGYGLNISNYYLFYEYIPTINGTITDSVINFQDINNSISYTTSSYDGWSGESGIIANLISHQMYKGLNLLE